MGKYTPPDNDTAGFTSQSTTYSPPDNDTADIGAVLFVPDPPTNLTITGDTTEGELTLDWDAVSEAVGYYVYRAESSGTAKGDYTQIADVSQETTITTVANGFEDMSVWSVNNGGQASDRVYQGSNSYYSAAFGSSVQASWTPFPNGNQPDTFTFYYQETSNSTGGGVRLLNSNGNYEGGIATDNPEFEVDFDSTSGFLNSGATYDEWVEVFCDFDWSNGGEVTISWSALSSGNGYSSTFTLKEKVDISTVELWNYNNGTWGDGDLIMWWDELSFEAPTTTPAPSSYTDTGIEDGEKYYYRVSSYF